ncbi:MAG: DUF1800 domain-containing protein [Vitreoscilla sp.]|nr:DUF1800 domain-containing protein [Vitreoscilla sp.]
MGSTPDGKWAAKAWWGSALVAGLAACGGAGDSTAPEPEARTTSAQRADPFEGLSMQPDAVQEDAVRLAQQASFGPSNALLKDIRRLGATEWVAQQLTLSGALYTSGGDDKVHRNTSTLFFCDTPGQADNEFCWRDWFSTEPLTWDFYRNAVEKPDQLRQRVALALQQVFVVSGDHVYGTYGFRNYHNMLLENAFGNYRELLRRVTLAPVMGQFLNHVNNDKLLPNENFARELLQLFSLGTCKLQPSGKLSGGSCKPVYDNNLVRNYAYALTGWTYPKGGKTAWGCWPAGTNCEYMGGDMVAAPALRDGNERKLLSGITVPAGATAPKALEKVLDSLMQHPNLAPFVSQRLIQQLVSSNPSGEYVQRVGQAFSAGSFTSGGRSFGTGVPGDMAATVAAVLLDPEARGTDWDAARRGHLREPILQMTGALRALNGHTDGAALVWWWGENLRQPVFRAPSVFNFYPPDYPVAGTSLVGPEFGIHNANTALERLNYLAFLLDWGGAGPDPDVPGAIGTRVDLTSFLPKAADAAGLVDGLASLTLGRTLASGPRAKVIAAVSWWTAQTDSANWELNRVRTAAYLVLGSPDYQVQR